MTNSILDANLDNNIYSDKSPTVIKKSIFKNNNSQNRGFINLIGSTAEIFDSEFSNSLGWGAKGSGIHGNSLARFWLQGCHFYDLKGG